MKNSRLGVLLILMMASTCLLQAQNQNQNQLRFDYDWMKTKPTSLEQKDSFKQDYFSTDLSLNTEPHQDKLKPYLSEPKNNKRYSLLIVVPNTDNIVEMPIMRIDTSIHYHLRWKNVE